MRRVVFASGGSLISQSDREAIRDRAYAIWDREGRPTGRDRDHWLQAAWELAGENARAAAAATAVKKPAKRGGSRSKSAK